MNRQEAITSVLAERGMNLRRNFPDYPTKDDREQQLHLESLEAQARQVRRVRAARAAYNPIVSVRPS